MTSAYDTTALTSAVPFDLRGVDGKRCTLDSTRGDKGLLVMFICNHCPYVKAIVERLCGDCRELAGIGIGSVAIMSNDTASYPADSFEHMKQFSARNRFPFPYVIDETQQVARAYGAVCTPDFFGFDSALRLQYRGRLDPYGTQPPPAERQRELVDAMTSVAKTGLAPVRQWPSIGCSIKWRD